MSKVNFDTHDCIAKKREELKKANPDITYIRFDLSTIADTSTKSERREMTGQRIEYGYKHKKKNGEEIIKTEKSFVTHKYCPFCGKEF